jgi:hypothetical protein
VSRPLRIVMENGWYHVMNRGIDGRRLFPDHQANEHFRQLLARMPTRFDLRIHAYVLMGQSLPSRRQLEEMAALGKWEDSWKESVKAAVLH